MRESFAELPLDVDGCWRSKPDSVGGLIYSIEYEGADLVSLVEVGRQNGVPLAVNQRSDSGLIDISANVGVEFVTFSPLELSGAKIVDSNADEVNGGTATWYSPDHNKVFVLLEPARRSPFTGPMRGLKRLFDPCEK